MNKGFGTLVGVSRQSPREGGLGKPHLLRHLREFKHSRKVEERGK
jgi:hypothetical protein